jgi:exopolysaccharide biosynthesis polyprenyl glycosylphosphotransferase
MRSVLAVGNASSVAELITRTRRAKYSGWTVTGVCTPDGRGLDGANHVLDVPVVGDLDDLSLVVGLDQYRVVAVTPTPELTPKRMHRLAWDLEGSGAEMVVDPGLMEIAGPRLHVAPVDGLPLLRVTEPAFTGIARVLKTVVDRTVAGVLILLLLPVLLAAAVAIKLDGGPVFFRQVRLGQGGRPFLMIKFRSMVVDAERMRADLLEANEGAGPLFKMARDPRVTRVGSWLRRYSLDELPQLFNVLAGSMSLVGPRPPLPEEARGYTPEAQRRLLVKPGMTGLWQVSGRSDLSWEESVRLDLRYVENWTMALDAMILWKTIGAVLTGRGAY